MHKYCSRYFIFIFFLVPLIHGNDIQYFQQDVRYEIEITLDDKDHSLSGFEKIEYTNNSYDTLDFIWFHLWPNAYKNNSTALGKQKLEEGDTKFYYASDDERGYIDRVIFPRDTRKELIVALERYGNKREERPKRKHGNIPL